MARKHGFFRPHVNGLTAIHSTTLRDGGTWVLSGSQLDLDFAKDRAFNRSTGFNGSPNGILTYTSPSPKMIYGDDGVLRYAPHNLFAASADLSVGGWTKTNGSISVVGDAYVLTAAAVTAGVPGRINQSPTVSSGFLYTLSFIAKKGTHNYIQAHVNNLGAEFANFDLDAGIVGTKGTPSVSSMTAIGDGYYLCTFSYTTDGTDHFPLIYMAPSASATRAQTWTSAGTETVYYKRAQFNRGSSTEYTPTTSAAVYSLPIDHDPITFAPLGVLIEEQRTNLLLRSQLFDNTSSWFVPAGATIAADNTTAPDGTVTADKLTRTSTSGVALGYGSGGFGLALTAGVHTLSYFAKADTQTSLTLSLVTGGKALGSEVVFNLSAGTAGTVTNYGATTGSVATIQELDNDWYRCSLTVTVTTATWFVQAEMPSAGAYWLWGAQLEAGAFPTSYIPTVASQVTRAADQVSILTSAFAYNAAEGSVVCEYEAGSVDINEVFAISDGTANNRIVSRANVNSHLIVVNGGTTQTNLDAGTVVAGVFTTVAIAYKLDDSAVCLDGGSVFTDTLGTIPTVTSLKLSDPTGVRQINGHIKRLTYFPTRKSNAELQALAA